MAKGYAVKFNTKALLAKQHKAFAHVNEVQLEQGFNYALGASIWDWPRETVRQNGRRVASPRDIRDSGDLINSYERQKRGPNAYIHAWRVPWALPVHEGAQLRNGTVLPPRPWTEESVRALPEMFTKAYKQL